MSETDAIETVLLVFNSRCDHCAEGGPLWADWIRKAGSDWAVLAVSSEERSTAEAFARDQGCQVEVAVAEEAKNHRLLRGLTARTPWVYVVESGGVVLSEGHGRQIAELTAAIREVDLRRVP